VICESCGQLSADNEPYCSHCGAPMNSSAPGSAVPAVASGSAPIGKAVPLNRMQRSLLCMAPGTAANAWLGVILGGSLAIVVGLAATWVLTTVAGAFVNWQAIQQYFPYNAQGIPLVMDTFTILMQRATMLIITANPGGAGGSAPVTSTATLELPITLLLLVPGISLAIGGYVAASTDFQARLGPGLSRGASIAIPYAALLGLLSQTGTFSSSTGNGQVTIGVTLASPFLYGLLWGILFGCSGALLRLYGKPGRAFGKLLVRHPRPGWLAPLLGGLAATGYGLGFAAAGFVAGLPALALLDTQMPAVSGTLRESLAGIIVMVLLLLPGLAIMLLGVASGVPIRVSLHSAIGPLPAGNSQFSLFVAGGHPALVAPSELSVLLLLPAVALFLGGRLAARIAGAPGWLARSCNGGLAGICYPVLLAMLSGLATASLHASPQAGTSAMQTVAQAGLGGPGTFLPALVIGAIFGALGGLSVPARTVQEYQGTVPLPTSMGRWLRRALRAAAILLLLALILGTILVALSAVLSYPLIVVLAAIAAFVATLIPLALLVVAIGTALAPLPPPHLDPTR